MATIKSAIELIDNFTAPMFNIINAANAGASAISNVDAAMNQSVSTGIFDGISAQAAQAQSAVQSMVDTMESANSVSLTNQNATVSVDAVNNNAAQQIADILQQLSRVSQMQAAINKVGQGLYILPDDASAEISTANHEIERLQSALDFISKNPFGLDMSVIDSQIESIQTGLDGISAQQQLLDMQLSGAASKVITLEANVVPQNTPAVIPVQWQVDNLDVFTGTGVERFQQEVQSANSMLNALNDTQTQIAAQAAKMNLLPANAVSDIGNLQNRISAVQQRIEQISNNPLNFGTDTANAGLEQLRAQLSQMLDQQQALNNAVGKMDVSNANAAYLQLSQTVANTERFIRDNTDAQGEFNTAIQQGSNSVDALTNKIKAAVGAYVSIQSIGNVVNFSDQITGTTARLNLIVDDNGSIDELQQKIMASAQRSRSAYVDTANAIASMGANAGAAFASNDELIAFMEQVNKQFKIGGADATAQANAMTQLSQAMAAGALRGDELGSILEQAPGIARTIESEMGWAEGSIKSYAEEGLVTAQVVKNALLSAADETNAAFEQIPQTWSDIGASIQNSAISAFNPVLQQINDIASSAQMQTVTQSIIDSLYIVAQAASVAIDGLTAGFNFVVDNWSIIAPLVGAAGAALLAYTGYMTAYNTVQTISNGLKTIAAVNAVAHGAAITQEMLATTGMTQAQLACNAALLASPVTWVVVGVIALIAVLYAVVAAINNVTGSSISATGIITGAVAVAGAFVLNTGIGVINSIITYLWSFVSAFLGIVEWVLNVANGGFNTFGDAVAYLIEFF